MLFKEKFARGEDSSCKMGVIILSHAANDDEGSLIPTDRKYMLLQTDSFLIYSTGRLMASPFIESVPGMVTQRFIVNNLHKARRKSG